jgi:hypothetical protein
MHDLLSSARFYASDTKSMNQKSPPQNTSHSSFQSWQSVPPFHDRGHARTASFIHCLRVCIRKKDEEGGEG